MGKKIQMYKQKDQPNQHTHHLGSMESMDHLALEMENTSTLVIHNTILISVQECQVRCTQASNSTVWI